MPLIRKQKTNPIQEQVNQSGLALIKKSSSEPKLVQKNIRLSVDDWNRLEHICNKKGLSISAGLRMIVRAYIEANPS